MTETQTETLWPMDEAILAAHPEWRPFAYRPATEAEAARYADRPNNPEWEWLYRLVSAPPAQAVPVAEVALEPLPEPAAEAVADGKPLWLRDIQAAFAEPEPEMDATVARFRQAHYDEDQRAEDQAAADQTTLMPALDLPTEIIEAQP